ncbi:MAG TPA: ABC transporter substrate-binding protein [Hyphomicrobiales bacterium]|nr:ABC transporter substrate-binding protein [Hyphomicrobiales bacterium]
MARFRRISLTLTGLILTALCMSPASAQDKQPDSLSLRLNWKMKGEFTPFIVAVEKGYFTEEGLDVTINEGSGATQALQTVASGQDDIAYVPSIQLIKGINQGMPVKVIATVVKADPMGMVAKSSVKLSTPADLEGKTVEISPVSTLSQIWEAFAKKNNIDLSKVNVVRAAPAARFNLLLSDKVDILGDVFLTNEYPVLQSKLPEKMNTLRVSDWGFKLLGYTLVANNTLIETKPDVIKRFNAAAIKAYQFTMDNPDEASAIAAKTYPEALNEATTKAQVAQLVDFLKSGEPAQLFVGDDAGWTRTLDILESSGAIDAKKSPADYYTNAFVPGAE